MTQTQTPTTPTTRPGPVAATQRDAAGGGRADAGGGAPWWLRTVWWLRMEGAAAALLAIGLFASSGASWWLFALLILAPDLSMAGYLRGPRTGAVIYNLGHGYGPPIAMLAAGSVAGAATGAGLLVEIAAIWMAHIGLDRMMGYGLKHPDGFRSTHLGRA